jgi:hypothetical protein
MTNGFRAVREKRLQEVSIFWGEVVFLSVSNFPKKTLYHHA